MQRKTFLKGVGAVAGAAATDPIIRLTRLDRAAPAATTVSKATLDKLEQAAYLHARSYYELHLPGRTEALVTDRATAGRLLHVSQTPSQRTRLSETYARLSGILGLLCYDGGQEVRAIELFIAGEDAAREAGSNDLLAWLYDRHADIFNHRRNPRGLTALVERGLEAAGRSETLTVARLHGGAAAAYASVGDHHWTAAHRAESLRILSKGVAGCWPSDHSMPRGFSFTADAYMACTAQSHARLGEYGTAAECYREALSHKMRLGMPASIAPAMALNRIQLAGALVHTGELEEATHTASTAVQEHQGVAKPRILRQAHTLAAELTAADSRGTYARRFGEFLREHAAPPSAT